MTDVEDSSMTSECKAGWMPIDTAPKGRDIIIMMASNPSNPNTWLWQQRARRDGRGFKRIAGFRGKPTHWTHINND